MRSSAEYRAVVFDILGTMVDEPSGIARGIRTMGPDLDDGAIDRLVTVWNRHVEHEQGEVFAGGRPFASSVTLNLEAAAAVAMQTGVEDETRIRVLAAAGEQLPPWPDSVSALGRIGSLVPVLGLSNASRSALTSINAYAGLRWHQVRLRRPANGG